MSDTSSSESHTPSGPIERFKVLRARLSGRPGRPNLGDVLRECGGARFAVPLEVNDRTASYALPDLGRPKRIAVPVHTDALSGMRYFFAVLPVEYLIHDERINPRAISELSLSRLLSEFSSGLPQLHPALAWVSVQPGRPRTAVGIFDGQHKAAAQLLLGAGELPVRVFVNPDLELLLRANTRAGTVLRQVTFDAAARRRLGSQRYAELIDEYRLDHGQALDGRTPDEADIARHFPGREREVRRALLDDLYEQITFHPDNELRPLLGATGERSDLTLRHRAVERFVYYRFVHQSVIEGRGHSHDARAVERDQVVRLLNVVAGALRRNAGLALGGADALDRLTGDIVVALLAGAAAKEGEGPFLRPLAPAIWRRIEAAVEESAGANQER